MILELHEEIYQAKLSCTMEIDYMEKHAIIRALSDDRFASRNVALTIFSFYSTSPMFVSFFFAFSGFYRDLCSH